MEQLARPGATLLTADTLRLAEEYVAVKPLGPVPVKGLEAPVEVYELTGAGPRRSRLHAAAGRGFTRFVGRDCELDQLLEALRRAAVGHGQVAAIVGEPGVGKSRLVWEMTHSHRTHGWLIMQTSSVSYGRATSYLPLIDLLESHFRVDDRDDHRTIREKVTGKLLALDHTLEPSLPAFLALLDVPLDDTLWQALDPPQRRQRTLDALKRLLLRESQVQPLLVVFEDLHWIDNETQALLDGLVESLPTARVLLLATYRPEYEHRWGGKTYYTQLRLDPLPSESARELLDALLGSDPSVQRLKPLLIERTEGNPFFLEDSVRTLVETQGLSGERGAYRLANPVEGIQVPATVQAVLAARIDRLPPEEKRLLQTAAVIGKDVPYALLQAIAETPDEKLRRSLAHLQAAEFLYETGLFPEAEYTFKHALTHEVAHRGLLQEHRKVVDARIVAAIQRVYPDRLPEHVQRLAHHALRGQMWQEAVVYLSQAGEKAMGRSANREAVACFEQALDALQHFPEDRDAMEQAIDLRFALRNALWPLGDLGRVCDLLDEAERLAMAAGDTQRLGRVSSYLTQHFWMTGDLHKALEVGERALAIATQLGDFTLRVETGLRVGQAYHARAEFRRAIEVLTPNIDALDGKLAYDRLGMPGLPSVTLRSVLIGCLTELGEFSDAIAQAEEGVRIADALDQPYTRLVAYFGLGFPALVRGDLTRAIGVLQQGFALCQTANISLWRPRVASALASACALSGRLSEALALSKQGVEEAGASKIRAWHPRLVVWLGEAYLRAGRLGDAMASAGEAGRLSRAQGARGTEAWAFRLLGEIAAHRDPPEVEQAEAHYRDAWALAHELGMRPLLAHCHLGLGRLYRRVGRPGPVREQLTTAAALYSEMDMGFYRAQAEAALVEVG
jgi:tetratricopeptide (TPR) repeat protein